ncbi:MAG TPA: hypothetical protein VM869_19550 [Enhygromyxa sp.]|nr:hypothetical protein [Enhygromyxa sp.]
MGPYLVLLALAGLGLALGWRLTPAPSERPDVDGIARLLQFGIAATGLLAIALLLVPFFMTLGAIECTPEAEHAGECLIGVKERGLFGGGAFACMIGVAFSFVLRKGVLDFPDAAESNPEAIIDANATVPKAKPRREPEAKAEPKAEPEPKPEPDAVKPAEAETVKPEPAEAETLKPEPDPTPEPQPEPASEEPEQEPSSHRRLEGPVFRAFVDDDPVELEVAIATAAKRLRSDRVAVVFSRGASKDANEALLELAEVFKAYRYVLEGTAAAIEGLKIGDTPDPHEADEIAGPDARHAMQLALDLAGGLIETVFLLDTRVAFPEFVLGQLTVLQSVCIAHAHDDVSAACQVVLPGTNAGEREGELSDEHGGVNHRRPRAWLVQRLVEAVREQAQPERDET